MKRSKTKPINFKMQCVGILHCLLKSVLFNICMLILGFIIGVGSIIFHVHYRTLSCTNHECIEKIETALNDINKVDELPKKRYDDIKKLLIELDLKLMLNNQVN